jgi:hypothetical protein
MSFNCLETSLNCLETSLNCLERSPGVFIIHYSLLRARSPSKSPLFPKIPEKFRRPPQSATLSATGKIC